ncbi:hypothetical protein ACH4SK_43955 [Streptomyces inhibens]
MCQGIGVSAGLSEQTVAMSSMWRTKAGGLLVQALEVAGALVGVKA